MGELRHPGCLLGEQGQEATGTTDYPSLVPFEGHKVTLLGTEKTEGAMVRVKERGAQEGSFLQAAGASIQLQILESPEGQLPVGGLEAN